MALTATVALGAPDQHLPATEHARISNGAPLKAVLDFGAPQAAAVSSLAEPMKWLGQRVTACGDLSHGIVNFVPLPGLSPTVTLEGGSLFEVDERRLAHPLGMGFGAFERLGYDFGDAHVGLELGAPKTFRVLLRGGFSMLVSKPDGFDSARIARSSRSPARTQLGASARLLLQIPI